MTEPKLIRTTPARTIMIDGAHRHGAQALEVVYQQLTSYYDMVLVRGHVYNQAHTEFYGDTTRTRGQFFAGMVEFALCDPVLIFVTAIDLQKWAQSNIEDRHDAMSSSNQIKLHKAQEHLWDKCRSFVKHSTKLFVPQGEQTGVLANLMYDYIEML